MQKTEQAELKDSYRAIREEFNQILKKAIQSKPAERLYKVLDNPNTINQTSNLNKIKMLLNILLSLIIILLEITKSNAIKNFEKRKIE